MSAAPAIRKCPKCGGKPWADDNLDLVCSMCGEPMGIVVEALPGVMSVNGTRNGSAVHTRLGRPPKAVAPPLVAPQSAQSVWELFDVRLGKKGGACVRLSQRGELTIGQGFAPPFGDAKRVELLYDRVGLRMAVRAAGDGQHTLPLDRPVSSTGHGKQLRVRIQSFFRYHGLRLPERPTLLDGKIEETMLIVQLKRDWTK